ncbi:hypothetical protein HY604_02390 [Candidatus Peregrinibacteria bacterium]|nr:hypothetical protein [Candidatus Peregrinibacteria bacterium]
MKKSSKIWTLAIVPLLLVLLWYVGEKIAIKIAVYNQCSQFIIGDDWVGCTIDLALEKNDARYCRSQWIFSPYPGLCMEKFAKRTKDEGSCGTMTKPRYKEECIVRFN